MSQFKSIALREQRIIEALRKHGALATPQIYDRPEVREVCVGYHSVSDTLRTLHKRKVVRRLPKIVIDSRNVAMWELIEAPVTGKELTAKAKEYVAETTMPTQPAIPTPPVRQIDKPVEVSTFILTMKVNGIEMEVMFEKVKDMASFVNLLRT